MPLRPVPGLQPHRAPAAGQRATSSGFYDLHVLQRCILVVRCHCIKTPAKCGFGSYHQFRYSREWTRTSLPEGRAEFAKSSYRVWRHIGGEGAARQRRCNPRARALRGLLAPLLRLGTTSALSVPPGSRSGPLPVVSWVRIHPVLILHA